LGAVAAVTTTVVVVGVVSKIQEKTHKDDPSYKSMKEKAQEKAIDITTKALLFATNHMDELKTVSSVVACALPIVELVISITEFRSQNRIEKEVCSISKNVSSIKETLSPTTEWREL
jgi:hypothetical protein